ncbi:MAG TPA: MCE family protein [Streptosporangiaceae bacterium]|jgi:phospholipid/cholesterol/gamma-HCH transport system substrate-binding protein
MAVYGAARAHPVAAAACAAVLAMGLAGCGVKGFQGIDSVPLPGGAPLGSHPYTVSADFSDVEELVPHSSVQVNKVAVGRVTAITLPVNSWTARVTMQLNGDVKLPANATARLEQSSLLGEEYIALAPADGEAAVGRLADHATIPIGRTGNAVQVEQVLGALSLLLNNGGISQLHDINVQLNDALGGNEPQIRAFFNRVNTFVRNLNRHRRDITRALDGLNGLSGTLATRNRQIGHALDTLPGGLRELERQRGALVTMLNGLNRLSGVAVKTINKSKKNTVADLKALSPTLNKLADAGDKLPKALQVLFTYPFTDQVLNDIRGDYLNTYLSVSTPSPMQIVPPITPPSPSGTTSSAKSAKSSSRSTEDATPLPLPAVTGTKRVTPPVRTPGGGG